MATVFLSYAREDSAQAALIEQHLAAKGVTVWRDQEQLRAGESWPKALGEAIAASDALLLLWSARAAESPFVEFEWCTALALKRPILPCLIDNAPPPASLAAVESVRFENIPQARKLLRALAVETNEPGQSHTQEVIRELAEIRAAAPSEVVKKAKAAFAQNRWTVQGSVYQAGGDIHVATAPPPKTSKLETWHKVFGIVGVLAAIIFGIIQLERSNTSAPKPTPAVTQPAAPSRQLLAGSITDDAGEPVPGVSVSVSFDGKELASAVTDPRGHYSFQVSAPRLAEVTVLAQRDHYDSRTLYSYLGDTGFNFQMRRKQ